LERFDEFPFFNADKTVEYFLEAIVVGPGFFAGLEIGEVIHFEMFFVAPTDDLMGPYEEGPGEETGVFFEAGLVGEGLVDLVLLLGRLFLHGYKLIRWDLSPENLKSINYAAFV
jgi:hypothetical protein